MANPIQKQFQKLKQRLRDWDRRRRRSREWQASQNRESILLLPEDLSVEAPPRLRIAVLGNCGAGRITEAASLMHEKVDHVLFNSMPHDDLSNIIWDDYDAVVVNLSLRAILNCVSNQGEDVFHCHTMTPEDYSHMVDLAQTNMANIIDRVRSTANNKVPLFFTSFIEPPCNYQGTLLNNRRMSLYHTVRTLNDGMAEHLEHHPDAHYIETNDLVRYFGDVKVTDAYVGHLTHAGLSGLTDQYQFMTALVKRITQAVMILRAQSPIKLIITDLDNTLWKGVLAEVDDIVPHEHIEGWPIGYVEALLEFKRRGGLLAISSKNEEGPTRERFQTVFGNRLSLDNFCSIKINWEPKSKNIHEILQETNLLPTNVLFIDDNPREIEEVRRVHPDIRTLSGEPTRWRNIIFYSPHTQVARITSESTNRTKTLQAKIQRDKMAGQMDRESYLRSLEIRSSLSIISNTHHPKYARSSELINKTNQFNTTGQRRSEEELHSLFKTGGYIAALSSADRLGDNGLVAAAVVRDNTIEQVIMSCRVFGLGLESALLSRVVDSILKSGHDHVTGHFQATGKNSTSASYFKQHGFVEKDHAWHADRAPLHPDWIAVSE